MTDETRMSLAIAGRKRQTVQTARRLAECSRKWRLRQETSDGSRLAVDRRHGGMCSCSVNDDRRRRRCGRLNTGTSWFRYGGAKRRIERRYLRFEQIQDDGHRHVGKISNGDISATARQIHFMFCSRVGFSGTAGLMALFSIRTNSRWQPPPSWIISNSHISATAHDLLI